MVAAFEQKQLNIANSATRREFDAERVMHGLVGHPMKDDCGSAKLRRQRFEGIFFRVRSQRVIDLDIDEFVSHAQASRAAPLVAFGLRQSLPFQEAKGRGYESARGHSGRLFRGEPRRSPSAHARTEEKHGRASAI